MINSDKVMDNINCGACSNGINCVNGRYCTKRKAYVEYATLKQCDYFTFNTHKK